MPRIVTMNIADGVDVNVLVPDELEPAAVDVAVTNKIERGLHDALDFISTFALTATERLDNLRDKISPNETSIEFSVGVGTQAGVVLASGSLEGQLKVTMTWSKPA